MSAIEMVNVLVFLPSAAPLDQWYATPNHYHCSPELFHVNNLWKTGDIKLSRIFVGLSPNSPYSHNSAGRWYREREREREIYWPQANKRCDNQNNKLMWQAAREEIPIQLMLIQIILLDTHSCSQHCLVLEQTSGSWAGAWMKTALVLAIGMP